jgi:hypothetical protein
MLIRKSLIPVAFAENLKEELENLLAPAANPADEVPWRWLAGRGTI